MNPFAMFGGMPGGAGGNFQQQMQAMQQRMIQDPEAMARMMDNPMPVVEKSAETVRMFFSANEKSAGTVHQNLQ